MAHGGIDEGELLLVVAKVGTAGRRFDHADEKIGSGGGEEGVRGEELVPKNPD